MIVELLDKVTGRPLRLEASQLVVLNEQGTPIAVAGETGMHGAQQVSRAGDRDFQQTLQLFGYGRHRVTVSRLRT